MSELDPVLQRAFSVARGERPRSDKGKAQTLTALGLSSASATARASSSAGVAATGGARRLLGWPWWALGVALVATSGAVFQALEVPAPPAPPSARVSTPIGTPAALVGSASADTAAPVLTVDQLPNAAVPAPLAHGAKLAEATKGSPPRSRGGSRPDRPAVPAADAPVQASDSLRDEIEAIERASRALSRRRCVLAAEHLAAYRAKFPNGKLRREADVVAIEIAGRSGREEQARTAARRFVAQFPDTPYALRLAPWLRDGAPNGAGPTGVVMCTDAAE